MSAFFGVHLAGEKEREVANGGGVGFHLGTGGFF
jgi:hypothetical protein